MVQSDIVHFIKQKLCNVFTKFRAVFVGSVTLRVQFSLVRNILGLSD